MTKNILIIIIITAALFLYIRYFEKRSIYFPTRPIETTPKHIGLYFEDINFKAADGLKLNGWFVPAKNAKATILFCHGNGGNISHRLEKISMFYKMGLNTFIFDYRGYGKSEGSSSEKGLYRDTEDAYNYLKECGKVDTENIILYGESLGGAVTIDLAAKQRVKAIITEDTFTSVKDMVKVIYPLFPAFILQTKFDSVSKIRDIKCPKLIMHSVDDEIVPFALGEKLFKAAAEPKKFIKLRGGHNTAFFDSEELYTYSIRSFIKEQL
ncbi:MAG: alpha/beta hydrolase [Candidatus Omnitrophota bacterium]